MATLDLPAALSARVMNALKADPRTVDLRALAPHFYALGARMLELFEEEEMGEILAETFKARAKVIADQAHNPRGALGEGADFLRGLDENERRCKCSTLRMQSLIILISGPVFRAAHDSAKAVRAWIAENKKR